MIDLPLRDLLIEVANYLTVAIKTPAAEMLADRLRSEVIKRRLG